MNTTRDAISKIKTSCREETGGGRRPGRDDWQGQDRRGKGKGKPAEKGAQPLAPAEGALDPNSAAASFHAFGDARVRRAPSPLSSSRALGKWSPGPSGGDWGGGALGAKGVLHLWVDVGEVDQ